jgi:hypothetical protein
LTTIRCTGAPTARRFHEALDPASVADALEPDRRGFIEEATRLAIESVEKGWVARSSP